MFDLPEAWLTILNTLIESPVAWRTPAELAEALGGGVEETTDLLCALDVAGWVDVWDRDPVPFVTLSALSAERLRVHLVEVGADEVPRWSRSGDPPPPVPRAKHVCASGHSASLAFVADPYPSPDLAAERAEEADALASGLPEDLARSVKVGDLPLPTLLIGHGYTPWPGPGRDPRDRCPVCGDSDLEFHAYCLSCDRWGMDPIIQAGPYAPSPSRRRRNPLSPEKQARKDQLQADRERARRKARRKARRRIGDPSYRLLKASGGRQPPVPIESAGGPTGG